MIKHNRLPNTPIWALLPAALLIVVMACGNGGSDAPAIVQPATATVETVVSTPTPNVEVIEIIETPDGPGDPLLIGSNAWWDSKAPVAEFQAVRPVLAGTPSGVGIWSLYAATFVASEWLSDREPAAAAFGPYVAATPFEELPAQANDLFARITALDPTSAEWLRPYQFAETDEEFTLVVNLGFAACLSIATWDECVARASGG